jgi:hypothetical protein
MEPISAIALSLALGAGAEAGKAVVSEVVKDAYAKLKALVKNRYPNVSVDQLEQSPESKSRRDVVEEDLAKYDAAAEDEELIAAAHKLTKLIESKAPAVAAAIGVDLKDVSAANLRLSDIITSGTGVKIERGTFTGDIDIHGVRAGVTGASSQEDSKKKKK